MKRILLVEDDKLLNQTLAYHLTVEGYEVTSSYDIKSAENHISKADFHLIILDVNLPDGSGFELSRMCISKTTTPVIFLTANDMESDMLKGYELGAKDYITKPFHVSVFLKKIRVLLNINCKKNTECIYDDGNLLLSFTKRTAKLREKNIELTAAEFNLLYLFVVNYKMVLKRSLILEKLWDSNEKYVDENALTMMISRIRTKIETKDKKYIKTIYGIGYQWIGDSYEE
ncbi:response regulator transcription factor [Tissierella pigra]|uniref:Response regulator transcription factor n=1 Tax=Tissierella pigra TaxID=2607614 RepID=A0A6N7XLG1_9FIRM|nr:response regulator transcription factor [Tissierella pigra]MBU5427007.1 response regulator transcription factor [Tissierella pigra]MSU02396.1 response regulator transcription factor [Tissierella pigra]